jgi:hypothetical protein
MSNESMFKIICAGSELQQRLQNPEKYYPPEVACELTLLLGILQKDGLLTKTDFYDLNTHRISAETFFLFYRPNIVRKGKRIVKKEVLIIDLKMKPADVFRQRFTILYDWDDKDVIVSIPQYDQPRKIIKAIELIHQGIVDSYELGYQLGHRGKEKAYIVRHGNYAKHTLEQLKLITRTRQGRFWLTQLTEKGRLIAEAPNEGLRVRLLMGAMLNYFPVWQIINAVTSKEGELGNEKVLTDELVKNLVFPEVLRDADTSNRRSQTLKNWIKWISTHSGIPICLDRDGIQLPIPMIYAEEVNTNSDRIL